MSIGVEWQVVWKTVLAAIGGSALVLSAFAWAFKTAITAWVGRDTEVFKARLRAEAETEIERLKSSLQRTATEHQVVFSRLHEKRAEVIEIVYASLTDLYLKAEQFVTSREGDASPQKNQEFLALRQRFAEVFLFIEQRRIFLPQRVCELLDRHLAAMRHNVDMAGVFGVVRNDAQLAEHSERAFALVYEQLKTDIPAARRALEEEFRRMLGVESS